MRRAARVDDNQPEIVEAFRRLGWSVLIISQLKNCCDIFVSKNGRTVAVEIKDGSKPPSKRKLTEGEAEFKKDWQGEYTIIESIEDVFSLAKTTTK
jgi:Holliday junction resolvase